MSQVSSKLYFPSFQPTNSGREVSIMRNSHPGHTLRKSGSFCLCLKWGERTVSAGRLHALGQFSWRQPGIRCEQNKTAHMTQTIDTERSCFCKGSNMMLSKGYNKGFDMCHTYASSSCFILVYSSLVMVASPSPSLCIFSLGLSKSGFGGAGGIYKW